jgi:undecaprenyl-diphosphatase
VTARLCTLLILALGWAPALLAEAPAAQGLSATPQAPAPAEERPFGSSTLQALIDYPLSPLKLRAPDLLYLAPCGVALGVLLNNDVPIFKSMAEGDARKPWLDHSMPAVTALGDGYIEFTVAALAAKLGDARLSRTSAQAMQGLIVVAVYSTVFKTLAWSNRPSEDDTAHRFWAFDQGSTGFPSGHSFSAFCTAEVYGAEYGRWWTYPLAGLIAYSRIYNQAHWPSDVLAGSLLGIAAGYQVRQSALAGGSPGIHLSLIDNSTTPLLVANVPF